MFTTGKKPNCSFTVEWVKCILFFPYNCIRLYYLNFKVEPPLMSDWSLTVYMLKTLLNNINYQTIIDNEMYNIDQKLTVLIFVKLFNKFLNTLPF